MRIALVIERLDPFRGGREMSITQVAAGLAQRGHEVTILCQSGSWYGEGVQVAVLGRRGLLRVQRRRNFVTDVHAAIAAGHYDVVHTTLPITGAHVYQPRGGTVPGQMAASIRLWGRLGFLRRAMEVLNLSRRLTARLERLVVADPSVHCLAVSQMVADELREAYGRVDGVRVVYNGVEVPDCDIGQRADWRQRLRFQLNVGPQDPVFLTVASNFRLKGVVETIAAFSRWYHSHHGQVNARLVIVGRELVEGYERMASLRDVGRLVSFVPPTRDIFHWYAAADAVVLLTWYDPCSRVILEAARWGIPSVTTTYNGAAEALSEGAGLVVSSPKDTRAVVAALDDLADPDRRARRVEACQRLAARLSVSRHVEELLAVYREVAQRK